MHAESYVLFIFGGSRGVCGSLCAPVAAPFSYEHTDTADRLLLFSPTLFSGRMTVVSHEFKVKQVPLSLKADAEQMRYKNEPAETIWTTKGD